MGGIHGRCRVVMIAWMLIPEKNDNRRDVVRRKVKPFTISMMPFSFSLWKTIHHLVVECSVFQM
jgi:hypothetical protein